MINLQKLKIYLYGNGYLVMKMYLKNVFIVKNNRLFTKGIDTKFLNKYHQNQKNINNGSVATFWKTI